MSDINLDTLDLATASARVHAGELDPVELTEACLQRIEDTAELNAWVTVDADAARSAARRAAQELADGHDRGPLHGMPAGVKDIFDTAGLRTTYGSARFREHVPDSDALAVTRLRTAGAVILGKQATHEFAWGGRTDNPHFGPTRNPHDTARIPGGSSGGGGASVAAGSSLLALGTDTAGSVRIPSALCGCVGFKPPYGWLDMAGAFPLAASLDHAGVLTRTPAGAAMAVNALAGLSLPTTDSGRTLRVGLLSGASAQFTDEAVAAGMARAEQRLRQTPADIEAVTLPAIDERAEAILTLVRAEAGKLHRSAFETQPALYGPDLAELLRMASVTEAEYAQARRVAEQATRDLRALLARVDVVMGPTEPMVAPRIGDMTVTIRGQDCPAEPLLTRLTSIANFSGLPAITVPAPGTDGLPVGVQFITLPERMDRLIEAASRVFE